MAITNGSLPDANDVRNIWNTTGNVLVGKGGVIYVPVYIDNTDGAANVYLYLWGKTAGPSTGLFNHGVGEHSHRMTFNNNDQLVSYPTTIQGDGYIFDEQDNTDVEAGVWYTSVSSTRNNIMASTAVPQAVQIWIDGTEYTASIGDQNTKGATMYDSGNDDWGINGTTEWDTGELDITSEISWTAGMHYIELKETGNTGGTLIYSVHVRPW